MKTKIAIRPARAIKITCKICNAGESTCQSKNCILWQRKIPIMQRIKKHCIDCAPNHKIDDCNGRIIGAQAEYYIAAGCEQGSDSPYGPTAICPLFPYRDGKNPNRSRILSEDQKKKLIERMAKYRFKKTEDPKTGVT